MRISSVVLLALGYSPFAQAAEWFSPEPAWGLQRVDWSKRAVPSTPWRTLVAEGDGSAPLIDWATLCDNADGQEVRWRLSPDWNGRGDFTGVANRADAPDGLQLPSLTEGPWWLVTKVYSADGTLQKMERLFINQWNSTLAKMEPTKDRSPGGMSVTFASGALEVIQSSTQGAYANSPVKVEVEIRDFDNVLLRRTQLDTQPDLTETRRWNFKVDEATPGRALRLIVSVISGERPIDREELWVATEGDSSPTPKWDGMDPAPPLQKIFAGETVNTFLPLEQQLKGLDIQLAGLRERGGGAIQLWVSWARVEMLPGAYDWSGLDAYVNYLTEKNVPFTMAGIGSVLFGNGPVPTWGDWMLNHEGKFKLWRGLPVTSPASQAWREEVQVFVRRLIERYRGNPCLVGYGFMGQGMDSGIFTDHYDSVTDYSPAAQAAFIRYLRQKYKRIARLNSAWGTGWKRWADVRMPLPQFEREVNLSPAWRDFTDWKLTAYRASTVDVADPLVAELDPERTVIHYVVKTGPFEHLLKDRMSPLWTGADGAGEDHRMDRINGITRNWGYYRQTESHDVPPANIAYMTDMVSQTLRAESDHIRFNLVWNSRAAMFEKSYPANAALQQSMQWWSQTSGLRERLAASGTEPAELGVVISWADMLYRLRAWRWYAMPASRADRLVRSAGFLPVRWLSEWAPDKAWLDLKTVLVPEDALVWDAQLLSRLRNHVVSGGEVVVWGRSGQYGFAPDTSSEGFSWLAELGGQGLVVTQASTLAERGKSSAVINGNAYNVAPVVVAEPAVESGVEVVARDAAGRATALSWNHGKGRVRWCLLEDADASEALVSELVRSSGVRVRVRSSAPEIEGILRVEGDRRLLVLSRYLGYGKKAEPVPIVTQVGLPDMPGNWTVKRLLPIDAKDDGEVPKWSEFQQGTAKVELRPSEMRVYEFAPVSPHMHEVSKHGDDSLGALGAGPAPRILHEVDAPLDPAVGEIPDGVTIRRVVYESGEAGGVSNAVYALIARPKSAGPHPGLLLLHGGKGHAEEKNALMWARRGYVVVTPDIPGIADPSAVPHSSGEWTKHPYGHERWRVKPVLEESMMFQSVRAAVQAFQLLAAQSDVDREKLGVHGISWGGYMTAMVSSIMGDEVKAAFAIFGTGDYDNTVFAAELNKLTTEERAAWMANFDACQRAHKIVAPYFIAAAANDFFFWPPAVDRTLALIPGETNRVFAPNVSHKLNVPGGSTTSLWPDMAAPYFAFYLQGRGAAFPTVALRSKSEGSRELEFTVQSSLPVSAATLYYSDIDLPWTKREWKPIPARWVAGDVCAAAIPVGGGTGVDCYLLISDEGGVSVSSSMIRID